MPKLGDILPLSAVFRCAVALLASIIAASAAQATPIEFANFHLLNANQPFSFRSFETASISAESVPVEFNFTSQSGLSTVDHAALMTIFSGDASAPASSLGGGFFDQSILLPTLSITEVGTGLNLLTMTSFSGDLIGLSGGPNASLIGADSTGDIVTFSSSFATFAGTGDSYNLGLATASPPLSTGQGPFLSNFVANIDGQFTTDSTSFTRTPEPSSVVLFGIGLLAVAALARRKATGAAVARKDLC